MARPVPGSLKVSNDCIADLAGYAAMECYGVVGMAEIAKEDGAIRLLPTARLRRGINVSMDEGKVALDLHVVVEQGVNIGSVTKNLTSGVRFLLKQIAELDDVEIRVHVEGIRVH